MTPTGAPRRAFPATSCSRPSRRSRLTSFVPPARPGSMPQSHWPMRDTATTPTSVMASPGSALPMPSASSPPPACGRPGWNRCRRSHGAGAVVRRQRSVVMERISRSRPGNWRSTFPRRRGSGSLGAKGQTPSLPRALPAVRVRPAHRDYQHATPRPEEWCLIEWPAGEAEPTKYFRSTLPPNISRRALVNAAKLRWRIERDYQDLMQELGLGHYEGRGWRGFHHHATLCIAAYGFLLSERGAIPPSGPRDTLLIQEHRLPNSYRPRGSPDPT